MSFADFDVRAYLQFLGVQFWESGSPNVGHGWIGTKCLYCHDDHNHLGIHLSYKNFSCWKCGATGSLLTLVQDLEDVGYGVALNRIDEFQSLVPIEPEARTRKSSPGPDLLPPDWMEELTGNQRSYLRGRGFNPDALVDTWGLLGGPITGSWRYRIIIPVHLRGQVVTWIGLDTSGTKKAKYKAAPVEQSYVPVGELLYGSDHVEDVVVVMEGPADVWRMGRGAVALLGMGVTVDKVVPLLHLNADYYFVMFDAEPLAQERAKQLAAGLAHRGCNAEIVKLDSGDPADLSNDEAISIRHELGLKNIKHYP